ncbi:hypothetical protein QE152_g27238 [Popillia japonica]|uniref:CCHC-type domain-containing protein n=1 Tax=Popillia japonica TaxID=7064 RepID=A0AAW1JVA1_POPJA
MENSRTGLTAQEEELNLMEIGNQLEELNLMEIGNQLEVACISKRGTEKWEVNGKRNTSVTCWVCNKQGHYARDCYHRADKYPNKKNENWKKQSRKESASVEDNKSTNEEGNERVNKTAESRDYESAFRIKDATPNHKIWYIDSGATSHMTWDRTLFHKIWYIDSGATSHMTWDRTLFKSYSNCDHKIWYIDSGATSHMTWDRTLFKSYSNCDTEVMLPDGNNIKVKGKGTIRVQVTNEDCKYQFLNILNALYVPQITENLLSVSTLENKGYEIVFKDQECKIIGTDNALMITGKRVNNLYKADLLSCNDTEKVNKVQETAQTRHRRFAHQNINTLHKMKSNGIVEGIQW